MAHSKDVHRLHHALKTEKHREHLIREAMKEKMAAEKAAHVAQHHQYKAASMTHVARNVGRSASLIGYLVIAAVIAFVVFMLARQYGWFGL